MNKFDNITSARGNQWKLKEVNNNYVTAAMQQHGISNLLAKLLFTRSVLLEEIPDFLEPKLKSAMPDPNTMLDMEKAVERIITAIEQNEKVAIYGDYDVDGASATAMLARYLRAVGVEPLIYIPDRMKEGYGINTEALLELRKQGVALAVSVDCGVTAFEPIGEAKKVGLDVVVIDHHLSETTFPDAVAIVNPNRFDDISGLNDLCASGVCFFLLVALQRRLKEKGFFKDTPPDLLELLDLAALGTVCDVMRLKGVNRAIVSQGLKIFEKRRNKGMAALADIAGLNKKPDAYSLGFLVGPRINAGGRIGDCSLGARILASDNDEFVKTASVELNELNKQRQDMEKKTIAEAMKQAEAIDIQSPLAMVHSENWHPGVVGIVAGRLKDALNKPTAVIAVKDGLGRASARSVNGVDLGSAVVNARNAGLLIAGGGHRAAAGFTVETGKIDDLQKFLSEQIEPAYKEFLNNNYIEADIVLKVSSLNIALMNEMEKLAPFGNGNSEPRVILEDVKIVKTKIVGEKHLQVYIAESGLARNSATIKGVCFNAVGTPIHETVEMGHMKNASLLGKIRKNVWNGSESVEFLIDDIVLY